MTAKSELYRRAGGDLQVSVVTITKNDPVGLASTRDSLRGVKCEWIVVDGSRTQQESRRTRNALASDEAILIQGRDRNRFHAMNLGLRASTSPFVLFLNGGDQLANAAALYSISQALEKNVWAVGRCIAVDSSGKHLWEYPRPRPRSFSHRVGLRSLPHQATVYRREELVSWGGFREDSIFSDWLLSLQFAKKWKPHVADDVLSYFLIGGISSQQSLRFWTDESHRLRTLGRENFFGHVAVDKILGRATENVLRTRMLSHIRADLAR